MNTSSNKLRKEPAELFGRLSKWRHFPDYQLERRADLFFSMYLVECLQERTKHDLQELVIPEFPIKRGLIWDEDTTNKSVKVDYVAFDRDLARIYFVELKTDLASRRPEQDTYLQRAASRPFSEILQGIKDIAVRTEEKRKYFHLLNALAAAGLIQVPSELKSYLFPSVRPGVSGVLTRIEILPVEPDRMVYYLQPDKKQDDTNVITFKEIARIVGRYDDELSRAFAASLMKWVEQPGSQSPE